MVVGVDYASVLWTLTATVVTPAMGAPPVRWPISLLRSIGYF
ncbi:hypothetical protein RRSWK_05469 [Rhodopirellula sp. SWK7]|nr:hypothetical protein RRSWK_05469 [Rhodopirellula sp. SWK7]